MSGGSAPESEKEVQQEKLSLEHLSKEERDVIRSQTNVSSSSKVGYISLYRYASRLEVFGLVICSISAVVAGAVLPLMTILFGSFGGIFTRFEGGHMDRSEFNHSILKYTLYLIYLGIVSFCTYYINVAGFSHIGERLTRKIRETYFKSILRQNVAFFDHIGAGEISTYINANMNTIQDGISQKVGLTISGLSTFVTALVIAFVKSWRLALVMLSAVVSIMLVMGGVGKFMKSQQNKAIQSTAAGSTLAEETVASMRTITALGAQGHFEKEYDSRMAENLKLEWKWRASLGILLALMMCILTLQYGLAFWQGSRFFHDGEITVSSLLTTTLASLAAGVSFGHIAPYLGSPSAAVGAASKIFELIERDSPIDSQSSSGQEPKSFDSQIAFRNLTHWYPSRPSGPPVLDNLNLIIPAGKVTAIVGASGSGKSTLISLIERFYMPTRGQILVDKYDIADLNLKWWRRQMSLVGQEPVLFSGTIHENIEYGLVGTEYGQIDKETRYNLVMEAAKAANAHEFISRLRNGYQTLVGERGTLLSGGQKQRIAIARALISNPQILLLDEATASLDGVSEKQVQAALDNASKGRTTIVIAHRLSSVQNADHIVVMRTGRIVEQGNHSTLMALRGIYSSLFQAQGIQVANGSKELGLPVDPPKEVSIPKLAHRISLDESSKAPVIGDPEHPTKSPSPASVWTLIRFVWTLNRPEMYVLIGGFIAASLAGVVYPTQGIFFGNAVFTLYFQTSGSGGRNINFWSSMFLILGFSALVLYMFQGLAFAYAAARLIHRSRKRAFASLLRQDIAFFDDPGVTTGSLLPLLTTDMQDLAGISGATIGAIVNFFSTLIGATAISCSFGWKLGLVCLSTMPALLFCGFLRTWIIARLEKKMRKNTEASALACEAVSEVRTVASLTLENALSDRYHYSLKLNAIEYVREVLLSSLLYALSQSLGLFVMALTFWYGGNLISRGEYTVKQFFVCYISAIFGSQAAAGVFSFANELGKAKQTAERLKSLLERTPVIDSWSKLGKAQNLEGEIELKDVCFSYPARPEQAVLQRVSLAARPGQFVAIVGPSGSGKSTIIALLERFYNPHSGLIMVDAANIATYNTQHYRSQMSLVSQETMLYSGSIRDNIVAGWSSASEESLFQACKDANIFDFIMSLPDGFSTVVGTKGCLLSGGQRQRVAIARALLRQPKILLLDEATSALDSESEQAVQIALDRAAQGRTTIAIAHRLSTIQHADFIYVMAHGQVVEQGTHTELMQLRGHYWRLAAAAAQGI